MRNTAALAEKALRHGLALAFQQHLVRTTIGREPAIAARAEPHKAKGVGELYLLKPRTPAPIRWHACSQVASKDKDFRYMATSDLLTELQRETFKVEGDTERRLVQV